MQLDVLLEQVQDPVVREGFQKILGYLRANPFTNGNWRLFELEFSSAASPATIRHNLPFVPEDCLVLSIEGNTAFQFLHQQFDRTHLFANVGGACRVRFLAGRVKIG